MTTQPPGPPATTARIHLDFWHADLTMCEHGWPPGTTPPVTPAPAPVRLDLDDDGRLLCAAGLRITHYQITTRLDPP
jgi:hypothetical protein